MLYTIKYIIFIFSFVRFLNKYKALHSTDGVFLLTKMFHDILRLFSFYIFAIHIYTLLYKENIYRHTEPYFVKY